MEISHPIFTVLSIVVGLLIGTGLLHILALKPLLARHRALNETATSLQAELHELRKGKEELLSAKVAAETVAARVAGLEHQNSSLQLEVTAATAKIAEAEAALSSERALHHARLQELETMGKEIERKFAALASEVLGKNTEAFLSMVSERFEKHKSAAEVDLEQRREAIESLVLPVQESLAKFGHQVSEMEKAREGAYRAVTEQVKILAESQLALRAETGRLVQALRSPKTRGRWGEFQLRNVLEISGMSEHVDFVEQQTIEGVDGRLRPDVIVRVPGGKSIVVDAKTPLEAYMSAIEEADESKRITLLAGHARQVKDHVRQLASREYWKALPETTDFVVMFVPGEAFFSSAIEQEPALFEHALRQRVMISTPMTFVALIKTIAYGWQQERIAKNAEEVAALARELFDRIKVFGGHMSDLGRALRQAVDRYNNSVGSLEARVLSVARRFENLGVVAKGTELPLLVPVDVEARQIQEGDLIAAGETTSDAPAR